MEVECWHCGGTVNLGKDQVCPHCGVQLPRFVVRIRLTDATHIPPSVHPDPIKRLEGEMAERFREFLIKELAMPFEEPEEEPQIPTTPQLTPIEPLPAVTPLAGMIHHAYIFDQHDGIVVNEEYWGIPVDEKRITEFAQRVKEMQDTLIEESKTTKFIGKPLGRGQVVLVADSLVDDDTLREKVDRVTYEFRRVIRHEAEYTDFIKRFDDYVTTTMKISIIGYEGTGKTDIVTLLNGGVPPTTYVPTRAIDIQKIEGARIGSLEISTWDFSGQDRYRNLWELYFRGSRVIIIVTDSTLENVLNSKDITDLIHRKKIAASLLVIANKQEYPRALPPNLIEKILNAKTIGKTESSLKIYDPALALEILSEALKVAPQKKEPVAPKPELVFD